MIDNALSLDAQIVQAKQSELDQFDRMKDATRERRRIEERSGLTYEQMSRAPWIENEDLSPNEQWDRGVSAIRRDYWSYVKMIAQDIVDRFKQGETLDIHEAVTEDVDGSQWVIYTRMAMQVLWVSENEDAFFDAGMEMDSDSIPWSQLAFFAMEQDLWGELGRFGANFDSSDPTVCPECDQEWSEHRLDSDKDDVYICPEEDEDEEETDDDDPA